MLAICKVLTEYIKSTEQQTARIRRSWLANVRKRESRYRPFAAISNAIKNNPELPDFSRRQYIFHLSLSSFQRENETNGEKLNEPRERERERERTRRGVE